MTFHRSHAVRTGIVAMVSTLVLGACSASESAPETTLPPATSAATTTTLPATTTTTAPPPTTTVAPTTTTVVQEPEPVDLVAGLTEALASLESTTVNFALASAELDDRAIDTLMDVSATLREYPGVEVLLTGNTDASGADRTNRDLSIDRAEAVRTWLVDEGGVFPGYLAIDGRGDREPTADNDSAEGQAANRRTDITVEEQRERGLLFRQWDATGDNGAGYDETAPADFVAVTSGAFGATTGCTRCVVEVTGVLTPPRTGSYTLSLAQGDVGTLWLSPDADPANLAVVIEDASAAPFDDFAAAVAEPVDLVQGTSYAIRARVVVTDGSDHVFLGWTLDGRGPERIPARAVEPPPE